MMRPIASLSLDLDNKWSYMKTHGDPGWEEFPSYLDLVVPRFLAMCDRHQVKMTVFVVGQDAALSKNQRALKSIAESGHEIGNHSFHHEPWLHLYSEDKLEAEIERAEYSIEEATGCHPVGFRGPGFSLSETALRVLVRRGYEYDCSTFPTFLGPLARAYYFMTARLSAEEKEQRKRLFGRFREGFRSLRPYVWQLDRKEETIIEIPVTTFPFIKIPIHVSYLLYLRQFSEWAAWTYFRLSMWVCRAFRVEPSLLLHPLDFLGRDDDADLGFFPAMRSSGDEKLAFVDRVLERYCRQFDVRTMRSHAEHVAEQPAAEWKPTRSMAS
jgi:hypothetical protein